jgi:mRNA-degrading endonuclease RelE of RelBE toxin-antitoxin system
MEFRETSIFTRRINDLLSDEDYAQLQEYLRENPDAGVVVPGSGGIRKLRWAETGRGKRGGIRVIYYHWVPESVLYMLSVYAKNEMPNLPHAAYRRLKVLIEEEFKS